MTAAAPAAGRSGAQAWAGFAASFEGSFDAYSDRVTRRMQELPTYEFVPEAELRGIVREGLGGLVPLVAERRAPNLNERRLYRHTTEAQASQGVTLDEMMQAWHMGFDVLRTWASEHVESEGLTGDVLLDFLDVTIPWLDSGVSVSVDYYRLAAQRSAQLDAEARAGFVRRVLTGDVGGEELRVRARMYGLNPHRTYYALRAGEPMRLAHGLAAEIDGEVWGFAPRLPDVDFAVGVSGPVPLDALARAFRLATRALDSATALGCTGCQDVSALGVHPAVLADHDVGDGLMDRFIAPVESLGATGTEILQTVHAYMSHQGHCERTGAELYVHANTVRYRVRRFEELTGTSLRDTPTFVAAWWALERHRLLRPAP